MVFLVGVFGGFLVLVIFCLFVIGLKVFSGLWWVIFVVEGIIIFGIGLVIMVIFIDCFDMVCFFIFEECEVVVNCFKEE